MVSRVSISEISTAKKYQKPTQFAEKMLDFASVRDLGLWEATAAEASFIILYFCPCFLKLVMYNCCIRRYISSKYLVRNDQPQLLSNDFMKVIKISFYLKL